MKISASTFSVLDSPNIGDEAGLILMAEAGFQALDFGFFYLEKDPRFLMSDEEHTAYYKRLRAIADDHGIEVHQAHSPVPPYLYTGDEDPDSLYMQLQIRAMKAASLLGAKYIVIHPVIPPACRYDHYHEEARDLPVAGEYDVIVAGSGPAGVSAAVMAGRAGCSVLLLESRSLWRTCSTGIPSAVPSVPPSAVPPKK